MSLRALDNACITSRFRRAQERARVSGIRASSGACTHRSHVQFGHRLVRSGPGPRARVGRHRPSRISGR
eukprot:1837657-Alexandrium_andersonii.AAC.1